MTRSLTVLELVPPGLVTVTAASPADSAGAVTVILESLLIVNPEEGILWPPIDSEVAA